MSEYQFVAFRAIDAPVSSANLNYMRGQSSRAEVTPWSFRNQYQYGDFHGDALEMLRRGYDMHLHYASFGIRKLMIRLPRGWPAPDAARPYYIKHGVQLLPDPGGPGGALCIQPYYDGGSRDQIWQLDELFESLLPLRAEILDGDLRPLYLAHLAVSSDDGHNPDKTLEAPVPAGLKKLSHAQAALAEFFGIDDALLDAAAAASPPLYPRASPQAALQEWLHDLPSATKDGWLFRLLSEEDAAVRRDVLNAFRQNSEAASWPVVPGRRTIAQLAAAADHRSRVAEQQAAERKKAARVQKLAEMAANPALFLEQIPRLVSQRSLTSYQKVGVLLADLREALAASDQADLAERQAQQLKRQHPTLRQLAAALRKQGFLTKK